MTTEQAQINQKQYGPNALTPPKTTPEWVKFLQNMFGGFAALLWIGGILCFIAQTMESVRDEFAAKDNVSYIHKTGKNSTMHE